MGQTRNRTEGFQARVTDMDPILASPYGPAAIVKRRNRQVGCTTERARLLPFS